MSEESLKYKQEEIQNLIESAWENAEKYKLQASKATEISHFWEEVAKTGEDNLKFTQMVSFWHMDSLNK